ncbi:hypothetical protein [Emticicia agri]|uniref:Tetratricopeptide repeat protein n=1 Tax=Emticicia agri TaxID=2492393 RepID=A0A4Q5M5J4_9BACT|nr:hypothetical protein [Emticicia agri]RYU97718.1 hypothetical protein EWM59_00930 [Emticicia agri]
MNNSTKSFFRLNYRTKSIIILLLMACGPEPFDYDEFKSFFTPESAKNETQFHHYNFTSQFLYDYNLWDSEGTADPSQIENTKAWASYVGVAEKTVTDELYTNADSKSTTGLTEALQQKGKTEAADYLALARKIESADTDMSGESESTTQKATTADYEVWLTTIETNYNQSTDNFVKERLAYQAVKVADMAGNPQKSIELYKKLVEPISSKTFISDWARSRMAGAYTHAGDSTQAYYHFSQVFVTAPTRRKVAHLSLRTYLPKLQDEALKLCKSDAEKANVYAATAVLPFQDALPMMEQIRELDINNPMLEFVMAREINKNEDFFFTNWQDLKYSYWNLDSTKKETLKKESSDYFSKLLDFSLESAENPTLKQSPFWYTAAAYLTFIAQDYPKANEFLQKAKAIPTDNQHLKDQIAMQEMILAVSESPVVTPEMEKKVIPLLERFARSDKFRTANNFNAACRILVAKYRGITPMNEFAEGGETRPLKNGKQVKESKPLGWFASCFGKKDDERNVKASPEGKAKAFLVSLLTSYQLGYHKQEEGWVSNANFMSSSDQYAIEDSTSSATINYTLDYFTKNNHTDFDTRLIKLTGLDNDYLYLVLGRRSLAEHQYAKAAEAWKHISPAVWEAEPFKTYLDVNPFHLNGQGEANPKETVTPISFAVRMAELQEKVNKNPKDYNSWLLLGCGSYNMSYFGNSWILLRRAWSGGEQKNETDDYYTSEKALSYFDKAMNVAPTTEAAAKACYLAAACQKIRYELAYGAMYDGLYSLPDGEREKREAEITKTLETLRKEKYATYFNLLKTKYQQTNYEEQLIKECSTYKDFLAGK